MWQSCQKGPRRRHQRLESSCLDTCTPSLRDFSDSLAGLNLPPAFSGARPSAISQSESETAASTLTWKRKKREKKQKDHQHRKFMGHQLWVISEAEIVSRPCFPALPSMLHTALETLSRLCSEYFAHPGCPAKVFSCGRDNCELRHSFAALLQQAAPA